MYTPCEKASCCQFAPTFGAPSFSTTSTFHVCSSFLSAWKSETHQSPMWKSLEVCSKSVSYTTDTCLHFSVVMSSCSVTTLGMGLMGTRSTPNHDQRAKSEKYIRKLNKMMSRSGSLDSPMIRLDTGMNLDATCNLYKEKGQMCDLIFHNNKLTQE